eukprot:Partr_v1_DN28213_c1_g1_i5_m75556 putative WD domain, G-beta repeat
MEIIHTFHDASVTRNTNAIAFNTDRNELISGNEGISFMFIKRLNRTDSIQDGFITFWSIATGQILLNSKRNRGPITGLVYLQDVKLIVAVSMDGTISALNSNGAVVQTINTNGPIFGIETGRNMIVIAKSTGVAAYRIRPIFEASASVVENFIETTPIISNHHTDIVKCIGIFEGKMLSAGLDRRIVIYRLPSIEEAEIKVLKKVNNAHERGITSMTYIQRVDASYFLTGSYDNTLKLWSTEGQNVVCWSGGWATPVSLAFCSKIDGVLMCDSTGQVSIINPRSGRDISQFIGSPFSGYNIHLFKRTTGDTLFGISRRGLVMTSFNAGASYATMDLKGPINAVAVGRNRIFTGGMDLLQWETSADHRSQIVPTPISRPFQRARNVTRLKPTMSTSSVIRQKQQVALHKQIEMDIKRWESKFNPVNNAKNWKGTVTKQVALLERTSKKNYEQKQRRDAAISKRFQGDSSQDMALAQQPETTQRPEISVCAYNNELSALFVGYMNGKIESFKEESADGHDVADISVGVHLSVTLSNHSPSPVTAMHCFTKDGSNWMISVSENRKLIVWNLDENKVHYVYNHQQSFDGEWTPVADGEVRCAIYNSSHNVVALASDDGNVYLRRFTFDFDQGKTPLQLLTVIQHKTAVSCLCWLPIQLVEGNHKNRDKGYWLTIDGFCHMRLWREDGMACFVETNVGEEATFMNVDSYIGEVMVGFRNGIIKTYRVVSSSGFGIHEATTYRGHISGISGIEICYQKYITTSFSGNIRMWNAPHKTKLPLSHLPVEEFPLSGQPYQELEIEELENTDEQDEDIMASRILIKRMGLRRRKSDIALQRELKDKLFAQNRLEVEADGPSWRNIEQDLDKTLTKLEKSLKACDITT